MNKKNNRSGFTLVELIVVMCLMGIIMGAVLNFIQPTAKLYKTTNTYLNEEEAVTTIANALEDDLMYATGVYVYATDDETKGPAEINNIVTEILNTPEHPNVKELSNCIVLDNVTVRDTPLAISKDSKGRILKYGWNGAQFLEVSQPGMLAGEKLYNNVFALQDQTFMGDDQFTFSIENSASSQNSMNIRINVYRPSYNGTSYVYNERTFSAVKAIEFLNIKAGNVTFNNNDVNTAASVSDPKYIYIFYNRKSRINANATRYPYECYVKDANGDYGERVYWSDYYEGDDISENVRNNAESSNIEMYIKDGYVYQRTGKYATVPDITEETNVNVVDLTCMPAASANPLKLYAVYTKTHESAMPALNVTFYSDKGMTSIMQGPFIVQFNKGVSSVPPLTYEPSLMPSFIQGERRSYQRWADCTTDEPVTNFDNITRDLNVYPQTYYYDAVTFVDESGNLIDGNTLKDSEGNVLGNPIAVFESGTITAMPDITQSGLNTDAGRSYSWVNEDDTTFVSTTEITAPITIKLQSIENSGTPEPDTPEEPPAGGVAEANSSNLILVTDPHTYNNWDGTHPQYTIDLKINTTAEKLKGKFTVVLEFSEPIQDQSSIICYSYPGQIKACKENFSGNSLSSSDGWRAFNQYTTIQLTYNNIKFMNLVTVNAHIK